MQGADEVAHPTDPLPLEEEECNVRVDCTWGSKEQLKKMAQVLNIQDHATEFHWVIRDCLLALKDEGWSAIIREDDLVYVGQAEDSLNSIYALTEPGLSRRSLGVYDVLCEIEEARRRSKSHLYLGYYISGCKSMEYKASYRPHQILGSEGWLET